MDAIELRVNRGRVRRAVNCHFTVPMHTILSSTVSYTRLTPAPSVLCLHALFTAQWPLKCTVTVRQRLVSSLMRPTVIQHTLRLPAPYNTLVAAENRRRARCNVEPNSIAHVVQQTPRRSHSDGRSLLHPDILQQHHTTCVHAVGSPDVQMS
jgi:hypothetical protein